MLDYEFIQESYEDLEDLLFNYLEVKAESNPESMKDCKKAIRKYLMTNSTIFIECIKELQSMKFKMDIILDVFNKDDDKHLESILEDLGIEH